MFTTFAEAQAFVRKQQFAMIDLKFTDLAGRWHHVTVPKSQFNEHLMRDGVGFDGSSVGLRSVKSGDMVLIPDLSTAFVDPFWDVPTLSFICSAFEADTKLPFGRDPRNIAIHAEATMRAWGIADESRWGPEYEFYVFDSVAFENEVNAASYRVESREADWQSSRGGHGHLIPRHGGYHVIPPKDQLFNLRSEMVMELEKMGIEVKYHHHEVGGPGQCEIETPMMGLVRSGDATQMVKYVTKMVAHRRQQTATFMPKPLYGEAGNGMHFHQHLFKAAQNVFYDADGYGKLSQTALWYIGGLLQHGPAVLAFTNPSTNSYRRLVPGFEAPVNAFFSLGNRSAAIRVPKYADQPDTARFEFRPPDATGNIYLALAVQLMAGLDGIRQQMDPRALGFGPIDQNIFTWSDEQRKAIKPLPASLREALDALVRDHEFLLQNDVFDAGLIADWIKAKYDEYYGVRNRPHPAEIALYYDV
ncbi:type I glutamate--ammonia ligase [Candidatus Amarolinea dominans]|uniref:type I glutamate--ammonia ligase n=1 Tax=Candidatus Amarolinea dominans TaxID=3140696 RepID=UPI003136E243|nr:type I glutamate--ammonia ligase [Anaerolineae bacterium]